jgi:membrane-bound lytic murein transglycosylase F
MLTKHEDIIIRSQRSLILFLLLIIGGCNDIKKSSSLGDILDAGVLKVGTTYGLTTYYNGSTGPVGFEYELAEGFASYLEVKLEVFPYYNLDDLFPQLADAHLDMIAAGISVSPERHQRFKFGPGYQRVSEKLVFKQGNKWPRAIKDLTGELVVASGSSHHDSLLRLQQDNEQLSWQETDDSDMEELLEMVLSGEVDYTIADSNILALMRRRYPELSIGFSISPEQDISWAVNKDRDDSLLAALIEYFGMIQNNGTFAALEDKYFGHVRLFNYVDTREFIKSSTDVLPTFKPWFMR